MPVDWRRSFPKTSRDTENVVTAVIQAVGGEVALSMRDVGELECRASSQRWAIFCHRIYGNAPAGDEEERWFVNLLQWVRLLLQKTAKT